MSRGSSPEHGEPSRTDPIRGGEGEVPEKKKTRRQSQNGLSVAREKAIERAPSSVAANRWPSCSLQPRVPSMETRSWLRRDSGLVSAEGGGGKGRVEVFAENWGTGVVTGGVAWSGDEGENWGWAPGIGRRIREADLVCGHSGTGEYECCFAQGYWYARKSLREVARRCGALRKAVRHMARLALVGGLQQEAPPEVPVRVAARLPPERNEARTRRRPMGAAAPEEFPARRATPFQAFFPRRAAAREPMRRQVSAMCTWRMVRCGSGRRRLSR